jgi:hypothetical protein
VKDVMARRSDGHGQMNMNIVQGTPHKWYGVPYTTPWPAMILINTAKFRRRLDRK